jgi:hypothetical protein
MSSVPLEIFAGHAYTRVHYRKQWKYLLLPYALVGSEEVNESSGSSTSMTEECVIHPDDLSSTELQKICFKNNVPLGWATLVECNKKGEHSPVYTRDRSRNTPALTAKEAQLLFKKLRLINKRSELIARILFFINGSMKQTDSYITLESLLRMKKVDIVYEEIAGIPNMCLELIVRRKGVSSFVVHYLPKALMKRILLYVEKQSELSFVFSDVNGDPLQSKQVTDDIKAAGREAGLGENIVSMSLRPMFNVRRHTKNTNKTLTPPIFT